MAETLTLERLKAVLRYEPETGLFFWLEGNRWRRKSLLAGGNTESGYSNIWVEGKRYFSHRLAWFYMTGEWPNPECDHRDGNRSNNRIVNLREATPLQNSHNMKMRKDNLIGLKGVYRRKQRGKYSARIHIFGKHTHLGQFDCPAAAHFAYVIAASQNFGEFARGGSNS